VYYNDGLKISFYGVLYRQKEDISSFMVFEVRLNWYKNMYFIKFWLML